MLLAVTFAVALILYGLGSAVEHSAGRPANGRLHAAAFTFIAGWTVATLVAVVAALLGLHLALPALGVCAVGAGGLCLLRSSGRGLACLLGAWLLVLPLIWMASRIGPTAYDEFTHWLPNARFLVENGAFPAATSPNIWSAAPGYPPALPLIGYAAQQLAPSAFETAAKMFNVMVASAFGLVLAGVLESSLGRLLAIPAGVAAATLLNPFFDPRTALTAYADIAAAFVLAMSLAACWRASEEGDRWRWWEVAAPSALLVLLRETGIVFVAAIGFGLVLLGRRGRPPLAVHAASGLAAFALWRLYLRVASVHTPLAPKRFGAWDWNAPWTVFRTLVVDRLANHPLIGAAALAIVVLLVLGIVARGGMKPAVRRLVTLCAIVTVTWLAFLAWSYMAVFSPDEIANAKSAWRYASELGPSLILTGLVLVFDGAPPIKAGPVLDKSLHWSGVVAWVVVPAGLLMTWKHWRFDCDYPDVAALQVLARPLAPLIGGRPLAVVHPTDAAGYAVIIDYALHRPFGASTGVSRSADAAHELSVDLGSLDRARLLQGMDRPAVTLMRKTDAGWMPALTIPSSPPAICRLTD